jgi:glycyl-tRNA synthetase
MAQTKSDRILHVATSRGMFYPSAEIYGAKAGFWTYGHLGTKIKHNWENIWRKAFLSLHPNYFEIEDYNILPKKVFESSGHLEHFNDPLVECSKCHMRYRADEMVEDMLGTNVEGISEEDMTKVINDNKLLCPKCQSTFLPVRTFNMMFDLKLGVTGDDVMYLRPESAQSPYLAFKREFKALREKIPMGLAVVGRAFRNEISPRQGFFRLREFTQAELQIFFNPDKIDEAENWKDVKDYKLVLKLDKNKNGKEISCADANKKLKIPKFYVYHMAKVQQFYLDGLQIPRKKFRFRELSEKERAFYNKIHFDIEIDLETLGGFKEVAGVHYRTDHDLGGHQKGSGEKMEVIDGDKRLVPHVLELSFGVDRNVWALMDVFFKEEKERNIFAFPASVAPYDAAVYPLMNKEGLPEVAYELFTDLGKCLDVFYDASGSIGRRYRRQDEVGTNYGITVDFDSLKKKDVTLRDRDSMAQVRVKIKDLKDVLLKLKFSEIKFEKAGKKVK